MWPAFISCPDHMQTTPDTEGYPNRTSVAAGNLRGARFNDMDTPPDLKTAKGATHSKNTANGNTARREPHSTGVTADSLKGVSGASGNCSCTLLLPPRGGGGGLEAKESTMEPLWPETFKAIAH